ncbi:hypothetical protein ACFUGD_06570 [Streptomyces sp. NPDC057217]|uniref:hypothetical protein n=1 Tax=Streptomyces sp. NPDC057217 TaxID=3346054 RepID=UPI00363EED98
MARRLVNDHTKMFRVVVIERQRRDNPTWERGNIASPRYLWDGPEQTTSYGPYNTLGAARGQLTFHTVDAYGKPRDGVVSGHIEEAHTTWARVGEQPPADTRPRCAHGYVLAQDSCPGCDAEQERPHKADPVTVRPEWAKRDRRVCRECGHSPAHKIHRTG